jgi:hypothetical protein
VRRVTAGVVDAIGCDRETDPSGLVTQSTYGIKPEIKRTEKRMCRCVGASSPVRSRAGRLSPSACQNSVSSPLDVGYEASMSEETLPGGNTVGAVRIGDVVHKQASPWTPTVHALLRHLEGAGVEGVPRALGFDDQGRQMLTFLPGEVIGDRVSWPAWAFADSTLVQVGQWLRRVHDVTAEFIPPADERWFTGGRMQPGWVVGHQDAAPYNAVMDGERLVGFFDWDIAGPSPREFDLAFSALLWVPLDAPGAGERLGVEDLEDRSRRLHLLLDAYGYDGDRHAFGPAVVQRARRQASVIRGMADAGDRAAIALVPIAGHLERSASHVETLPDDFWTR